MAIVHYLFTFLLDHTNTVLESHEGLGVSTDTQPPYLEESEFSLFSDEVMISNFFRHSSGEL